MREILYGRQPVRETLRANRRQIFKLLLAHGVKPTGIVSDVLSLAQSRDIPVQTVDRRELEKLGGEVNHQGLAAEVSGYPYLYLTTLLDPARQAGIPPFLLLLDHIQDPQNLGSLLRTAEAAGIHGVVIPGRRAAGVTPAAVRASAGAAEHVRVAQVTNLVQAMERLKAEGLWFAGLEAEHSARYHTQADLSGPLGLVVGSEGRGLARLVRETCDFFIRLPMDGQVESLNAAVAGGIALYEARRQRDSASRGSNGEPAAEDVGQAPGRSQRPTA
jgi:23S rRNA (guanosine2251-2'-O)-methyltransferase